MPRYLADFLGGLPGFRPTDNRTEHATKSGYLSALGGSNTVGRTNLLDPDPTFYDDTGAYGGETVADLRMGGSALGGVGQPYRNVVPPPMAQQAQQMAALDKARLAPVTPGPAAHGTAGWIPPGERGGQAAPGRPAPPDMPPGAGQTMALSPAGATPPQRPNFLSAPQGGGGRDFLRSAGRWLNDPIMNQEPGSGGTSRFMAIGQLLSGIGAGMANGGGIGGGIQGLNRTVAGIRQGEQGRVENEEERQYRRLEMKLKRRALEQKVAPQTHVIGAGGALVGPGGEELYRARPTQKDATTAEAALLDPDTPPEIKAQAQAILQQKREPSARDIAYIQHLQASGQHQKAMEEIAKIRANKPAGDRTVGTSEYERLRERLPPEQRAAADRKRLDALTTKGESAPFSAGELAGARKDYRSIQKARADITRYAELYEKHGNQVLPGEAKGEMEAAYGAGLSALAAANNTGVIQPGELPMLQKQLLGPGGFGAEAGEMLGVDVAGQVRGQANTMLDRLDKAEQELVGTYGADTLTGAKRDGSEETDDLPLVRTPEEAKRLPPGTWFRNPDGERLRTPGG